MEAKNIDDVLISDMNNVMENQSAPQSMPQPIEVGEPVNDPVQPEEMPDAAVSDQQEVASEAPKVPKQEEKVESTIDEYGNPTEKQKLYTEEEVNRMMRERLARGKYAEQQVQQPKQTKQQEQPQDQEENWEAQLESFVDRTIEKRQAKLAEQQWQQQELARQADFEAKFSAGMNRYTDFRDVVSGKNITDSMLLATRNLENPAAFVYGAAKMHPQELERISKIADPYVQAAEIGRLHEKMVKTKNVVSSAPKPIEAMTSDMPAKKMSEYPSLEERIHQYAKQKIR